MKHITIKDLVKNYGNTQVLKGVSFEADSGEAIALIGANGSGKSTLLRSCIRLIEPNSGTIHVEGTDVRSLRPRALRQFRSNIGFVFQKHQLVPRLSALTNVIHGALGKRRSPLYWYQATAPSSARERALDCLDRVGLAAFAGRRVDQLSGGQAQRVAIARSLMQEPKLLLADEPTASLDPVAGKEVMELMFSLANERGITLIFTCHDMELACEYSGRIIGLRDGTIQLDCLSSEQSPEMLKEFFGGNTTSDEVNKQAANF